MKDEINLEVIGDAPLRFAGRVALAAGALSLMMLAVAVGVGQGQSTGTGQTATAPSQLTEEYPLGERRLCCGENGTAAPVAAKGSPSNTFAAPSRPDAPDAGDSMLWLLFLVPLAVLVFLVWFVAYARSGPPTAYGYALGNEPRRRRRVPQSMIRLLTPLLAYNHHRDAYVLRGIGNRRGPVLKLKREGPEPWAVRPATAPPAAAPLGVRGEGGPASVVREPAPAKPAAAPVPKPAAAPRPRPTPPRAAPNGGAPANGAAPERRTRPEPVRAEVPKVEAVAEPSAAAPARAEAETPAAAEAPPTAKPKHKSGKAKAGKKAKAAKAGKNGKGKKAQAAPKATKSKAKPVEAETAPSLTDALATQRNPRSARAKRRAAYRARHGGGAGSPERDAGSDEQRSAPTGRFKRDEPAAARDDRPATKTRK